MSKSKIRARPGWADTPAVKRGHLYEIPPAIILQPGPASLTDGVRQIHAILARVVGAEVDAALAPAEAS